MENTKRKEKPKKELQIMLRFLERTQGWQVCFYRGEFFIFYQTKRSDRVHRVN